MVGYLDHLQLVAWPFSIVPRQQYCDFLAGRAQLQQDISSLVRGLSRRDTSSIHVLWSWLGAGKTHSLFFLMKACAALDEQAHVGLCPIYTEFPKRAQGFYDLYQSAVYGLDSTFLSDSYLEAMTSPDWASRFGALSETNPDLSAAFRNMVMGKPAEQLTALRWLRGDALPISEFRRLGVSQRIGTADQAVKVFSAIIELCDMAARSKGKQGFRLIWILDEFQRIARCTPSVAREINAGLHSLFNACPVGLTLIISFSGPPDAKRLPDWLSPELRNRIGATKVLILPPFQQSEALEFVAEVLAHFRIPHAAATDRFFPFTKDSCEYIIGLLAKKSELRPRIIMHAMHAVLEAADPLIEQKTLARIDRTFAEVVLRDYIIVANTEEENE
jgi:hypothetical protein